MFGSDEIIRVGMIGCGSNARGHMRRLLDIEGVEIVAICDPDDAAVTAAGEVSADIAKARVFRWYVGVPMRERYLTRWRKRD